jgi:hypothetical protein
VRFVAWLSHAIQNAASTGPENRGVAVPPPARRKLADTPCHLTQGTIPQGVMTPVCPSSRAQKVGGHPPLRRLVRPGEPAHFSSGLRPCVGRAERGDGELRGLAGQRLPAAVCSAVRTARRRSFVVFSRAPRALHGCGMAGIFSVIHKRRESGRTFGVIRSYRLRRVGPQRAGHFSLRAEVDESR